MTTWRSEASALALVALLTLPGCLPGGGLLPGKTAEDVSALVSVRLGRGDVTVRGPEGYCIDAATVRRGSNGDIALLGSCRALAPESSSPYVAPVLMSVSVLPRADAPQVPDAEAIRDAFAPGEEILDQRRSADGLQLVHLKGNTAQIDGVDLHHWRGALTIGHRPILLGLYAPKGSAEAGADGATLLTRLAQTIRQNSPAERKVAPADAPQAAKNPKRFSLRRLFGPKDRLN